MNRSITDITDHCGYTNICKKNETETAHGSPKCESPLHLITAIELLNHHNNHVLLTAVVCQPSAVWGAFFLFPLLTV